MDARLDFYSNEVAGKFPKHINSAGSVITGSTLSAATQELVKIRASQINGCGVCLDMHTKDAEHAGENSVRINLIAAWREATVFTEAERAALELTEQGTRVADGGGVHDEAWTARPSISTTTSSAHWCALLASSTFTTASTPLLVSPQVTTHRASGAEGQGPSLRWHIGDRRWVIVVIPFSEDVCHGRERLVG